ncbi:tellurite resistance protein TehB [Sulfurirhabdus autotrophica]|uniref:Tellurite resistance protein TehB n=2 Tax=Sulfurirhabdus autotrophica TaxID=1706046 RepID=A0A4R3YF07_9PROT|nr:tellurite resistance protein TehB [Sulfurirhabdus autotrophica]
MLPPSEWVVRWVPQIAPGSRVLDLAAGSGRHTLFLAEAGLEVCAVDKDISALTELNGLDAVSVLEYDLEQGVWSFEPGEFAGIVVTNYLHRPLFPNLLEALAEEGVLIYETFAVGNEVYGKPSNPDFLLQPGELLQVFGDRLRILGFEEKIVNLPKPAKVQRICGVLTAK